MVEDGSDAAAGRVRRQTTLRNERLWGHVVGTAEDDDGPDYAFTAGMFQTHEAPGICIVGLDEFQVMMQ